jgi:multidrug efflux system outer membrane protein
MTKKIFSFLLIVLTISSCKLGPNYQRPDISAPGSYRFGVENADSVLNLKWWEIFKDDYLTALIDSALKNNYDIRIAAARIAEAKAIVGYNKADLYPSFGYEVNASKSNLTGNQKGESFSSYFAAPSINWEIDFWGKYRRYTEAARADLLAAEYSRRTIQLSLIAEVASTYFILLDYDSRLAISKQTLDSRKESLRIIRERFNTGIIPELDLNQAQMQEADAAAAVPLFERAIANTENALSILLGKNPGNISGRNKLKDQKIPNDIPAGIPSSLLERRPDILQAEQNLISQNAKIGAAQAMRLPAISLTGFFGLASPELNQLLSDDGTVWSAGAGMLGPIYNFGKNKRKVEIERQRMIQDSLAYIQTVMQAFQDVSNALIEVSTYKDEVAARERQRDAAVNANMLSKDRYDGGVTSYLEVLDSERSLFQAELSASETFQEQLNAYVNLYKALGGGWVERK